MELLLINIDLLIFLRWELRDTKTRSQSHERRVFQYNSILRDPSYDIGVFTRGGVA